MSPKYRIGDKVIRNKESIFYDKKEIFTVKGIEWKEDGGYHGCWGYFVEEDTDYCFSEPILDLAEEPKEGTCGVCTSTCKADKPCEFMVHR